MFISLQIPQNEQVMMRMKMKMSGTQGDQKK